MPLPTPIGAQREALYYPATGHTVVLGTAGSGKTTLAILRSRYIAQVATEAGRTLLVTFNKMLTTYLETIAADELTGVDVRNYHHFARGYLHERGKLPWGCILNDGDRPALIESALGDLRQRNPNSKVLRHDAATLAEELVWIARMGLCSHTEYERATRVARGGLRVVGRDRGLIWELYEAYRTERARRGFLYDWHDIAQTVLHELQEDDRPRRYRHVVIDEGQDFSPVMVRSLVAAVPEDGSVTFFGDMAQQIYGGRISWRDAGLLVGPQRPIIRFQENYRNTRQVAALALALAGGPHFAGVPDLVEPRAPKADGTVPVLVRCPDAVRERQFVVRQAAQLVASRRVAILLRTRGPEDAYWRTLEKVGIEPHRLHRDTTEWSEEPGVWVGTYHAGKGLEFATVFLPQVDAATVPDAERMAAIGDDESGLAEEARLLYVAITRARADLVLTYVGAPTPLLDHVPTTILGRQELP